MPMISASTPSLRNSPFSWTTQIGLAAGFSAAHAILAFSCAAADAVRLQQRLTKTRNSDALIFFDKSLKKRSNLSRNLAGASLEFQVTKRR